MSRETLGDLEHQVLLALLRLGNDAYTAPVVEELEARTGRGATTAAVYVVLRRLEAKGLVVSGMQEAPEGEGGRDRRCFEVTGAGKERLRAARDAYVRLWDGIEEALEG